MKCSLCGKKIIFYTHSYQYNYCSFCRKQFNISKNDIPHKGIIEEIETLKERISKLEDRVRQKVIEEL